MAVAMVGTAVIKMNAAGLRVSREYSSNSMPVDVRHANVGDDQVVDLGLDFLLGGLTAGDRFHHWPFLRKAISNIWHSDFSSSTISSRAIPSP